MKSVLQKLKNDKSHKTIKLRQAINILKHDSLKDVAFISNNTNEIQNLEYSFKYSFDDFKISLEKIKIDKNEKQIHVLPLAFLAPSLIMEKGLFKELSSGEQHFLNSIHSILYHITNLVSVYEDSNRNEKYLYKYINVVLDEIELYFHPEMQRIYISELIKSIKQMDLQKIIGINLIFATHSPFILSDIHSDNILFLERKVVKGMPESKPKKINNTFGANINDMLLNSFFMDSTVGEIVKSNISELIQFQKKFEEEETNYLSLKKEYEEFRKTKFHFLVNSITDPVIKNILKSNLEEIELLVYGDKKIHTKIESLKRELKILEKKAAENDKNQISE